MGKCSWVAFERGAKTVLTFIFSHVGLCALVLGYSIAGAFLFSWLEQKSVLVPFNATEHIEKCIDQIFNISEKHGFLLHGDLSLWRLDIIEQITNHEHDVTLALQEDRYDKTLEDLDERWSIINSLFYCVTAITTIGYGHIYPRTTYGRIVTIAYSLFGIPLMLLCLNNIGDSMASTFRFTYRRIFCCKSPPKPSDNLPSSSNQIQASNSGRERPPYQPPQHYKPSRRNMLISPPISATIHRGSDLPTKMPTTLNVPNAQTPNSVTPSSATRLSPRQPHFPPHSSPCIELDVKSIVAECAAYTGTPLPDYPTPEPVRPSYNQDYDIVPTQNCCTPSPSPPGLSAISFNHSVPSSPLSKESPSVWFTENEGREPFLTIPALGGDGHYSAQSTRPASPLSGWVDQNSMMGYNGRPWTAQDSSASVTWASPIDEEHPISYREHRHKRPAGKTLVVYNTLSGDALKQQTKIQKKMALNRAKRGQLKNDATTVFTDPVSGQPVNGDLLGLNYRPIEIETSDRDTRVPMSLVLLFVLSYLVMGAVLFSSLESWHFLDSFYFCFITLSTIGFGDLVPGNLGYETREAQIKLVALALYLLVGLSVLAMSFSLVQEEVVLKCKAFAQYIGLKDE